MLLIYITFPNKKEARKLGREMVKQRLVACVNVFPIDSIYWWNKKIVRDKEVVMIVKTIKGNYKKIENFIKKRHSYKVPCVMGWEVGRVNKEYGEWVVINNKSLR